MTTHTLDSSQQAVLNQCVAPCTLSVIGAPGSGKTEVLKQAVLKTVSDSPRAKIAVLSPDRRAATQLRNELSVSLGGLTDSIAVQSINAFAFKVISEFAQLQGRLEPQLISGPDQDVILKEIFELVDEGALHVTDLDFIDDDAAQLPAYRAEFRDLITRAAELGLGVDDLCELGKIHDRKVWIQGAQIMGAYEGALAAQASAHSTNPDRIDHARLMSNAAGVLRAWETSGGDFGGKAVVKPRWDWVFVDDVQNATLSLITLLRQLQDDGASIVVFGNPDLAVQGFRGGIAQLPTMLSRARTDMGIGAQQLILEQVYRGNSGLRKLARRIESGIHVAGVVKHRRAEVGSDQYVMECGGADSGVERCDVPSIGVYSGAGTGASAQAESPITVLSAVTFNAQVEAIGAQLRRLHLHEGVPYREMAIITRSHNIHSAIRRALVRMGIPVEATNSALPLREQPAVHALLDLLHLAIDDPYELSIADIEHVLTGRLSQIDSIQLRKIRRELHGWELYYDGHRSEQEVLLQLVRNPHDPVLSNIPSIRKIAQVIISIRQAHSRGQSADEVLWEAWNALDIAEKWRSQALGHGILADIANADLDAVIQLFRVAQRLNDRKTQLAGIERFLDDLELQDLPEDSIARTGVGGDEVTLGTPSSVIGRSWDHVVIVEVNQGVWPNTRLRNPLTRVPELVSVVVGAVLSGGTVVAQQLMSEVLDDELRMLLQAVSRARQSVTFTFERNADSLPSSFIEWLCRAEKLELKEVSQATAVASHVDAVVGRLRQISQLEDPAIVRRTQILLDRLKNSGFAEADSNTWVDCMPLSSNEPVFEGKAKISPSKVETTLECPMREFLKSIGAQPTDDTLVADLGSLIHKIAEEHPTGSEEELSAALEEKWHLLGLDENLLSSQRLRARAELMVRNLAKHISEAPDGVRVEVPAYYEADDYIVRARIDRIEFDSSAPRLVNIVDLKTGKNAPTKDKVASHPQLLTYQWLISKGGVAGQEGIPAPRCVEKAQLVHLGASNIKKSDQERAGIAELEVAERNIETVALLQRGPDFPARPDEAYCSYCAYVGICPAREGERVFS
ncbi:superfamily I DNA/RNA helicase/RecB family exonuclease [Arcanobacterium pluranimalium]|uniref:UrvD/REP family ATP-dependent DNA helicase n=1 Tax=Arcanobacterium pluranimalium TaxID=108028 RepID=UPI00195AF40F|nr:UrvD/REP family ATP-dependent DNA helicase [Arcanobacterium pluranimalium]MBM7825090.1 superfamily I DNA/RNA helicase/RecB family exonuclease [Arcanobacterium pluranimalium]